MTRDSAWVVGQFALAGMLVLVSAAVSIGGIHGFPALLFWAVLPGAAASFVVNAFVMRRHGDAGLVHHEKVALVVQVVVLAAIVAVVLAGGSGAAALLGIAYGTPVYVGLAAIVLGMAIGRNRRIRGLGGDDERFEDAVTDALGER